MPWGSSTQQYLHCSRWPDRRTGTPDPYPTTVNTNPSARVQAQTNELSDGDFAQVASGTRVLRGLGGHSSGSSAGASATGSLAGTVNQNVQRGLAPLQILSRGQ